MLLCMILLQLLLLWMVFSLLFGVAQAQQQPPQVTPPQAQPLNVSFLNQTNAAERWPNLLNCVRCQNVTDYFGQPLLMAADDAVAPPLGYFQARGVAGGLAECTSLSVVVSAIRTRSVHNPQSVTLRFMRDAAPAAPVPPTTTTTAAASLPGEVFYQKTVPWPANDYLWQQDWLGFPWPYRFTLQWNELGDDGVTRFNFRDPLFLPPGRRFWFGFFCTVDQEARSATRLNAMFWVTLNNATGSTPPSTALLGGSAAAGANRDFAYRDTTNLYQRGWTNWTTATAVEPVFFIQPTTNNLAWQLYFTCLGVPPTEAPSEAPSAPLAARTDPPGKSSVPTAPPAPTPDANRSEWNRSWTGGGGASGATVALAVVLPLSAVLACACLVGAACRWRKRALARAEYHAVNRGVVEPAPSHPRGGGVTHDRFAEMVQALESHSGGDSIAAMRRVPSAASGGGSGTKTLAQAYRFDIQTTEDDEEYEEDMFGNRRGSA